MDDEGLHARFGRQIALPEIGRGGQERLGRTPVDFGGWPVLAEEIHRRAGGVVEGRGRRIEPAGEAAAVSPAGALGVSAWAAVEAARRLLDQPPATVPSALCERLGSGR